MLERDIENKVCKHAKGEGMLCYKFVSPSNRSVCDRIFIYNGLVFFIEFKAKGKVPTRQQHRHHLKLLAQSMVVYVVDNVMDGIKVIENEKQNKRFDRAQVRYTDGTQTSR
jgi:hypothetical protein